MSYEYSCIQNIEPERGKVMLHHPRENSGLKTMEMFSQAKGPQQF